MKFLQKPTPKQKCQSDKIHAPEIVIFNNQYCQQRSLAKIKYYRPKPFNFRYEQPVFTFPKRTTTNQKFFFWDGFRTYCSKRSSYIISGGKWIDTLQVLRLESATRRIPTCRIGKTLSVIPVVAIYFITNDVPQTTKVSLIGIPLK